MERTMEDEVIDALLRIKEQERDLAEQKRRVRNLLSKYGQEIQVEEIEYSYPEERRSITQRSAVLRIVKTEPGLKPADIWERAKAMGVTTKNPRPTKAISMTLEDLKKAGLVENRDGGWYSTE